METRVTSNAKEVIIGDDRPTVLISERINPSGNKNLPDNNVVRGGVKQELRPRFLTKTKLECGN